jgi:hypothetical protein
MRFTVRGGNKRDPDNLKIIFKVPWTKIQIADDVTEIKRFLLVTDS